MKDGNNRYAWTWTVKPEFVEEYVRMHLDPWPEILEEHRKAGISSYSIFRNGNQFFYVYESEDPAASARYIAASEACKKWDAITSKMVEGSFDYNNDEPIKFMEEVFFLR